MEIKKLISSIYFERCVFCNWDECSVKKAVKADITAGEKNPVCDTSAVVNLLDHFYIGHGSWFIVLTPFSSLERHSTSVNTPESNLNGVH